MYFRQKKEIDKSSYYYRYKHQAYLFEGAGVILLAAGILVNELTGRSLGLPAIILAGLGAVLLIIGGSSSQPHVLIRSFASLLMNEPTKKNADEFIRALEYSGRVRLVKSHQNLLQTAVSKYAASEEADDQTVEALKQAIQDHIKTKII